MLLYQMCADIIKEANRQPLNVSQKEDIMRKKLTTLAVIAAASMTTLM